MLSIVGGTYKERCLEPKSYEIFGSGLRAAIALSNKGFNIQFNSCIGIEDSETVSSICNTFNIVGSFKNIDSTISFNYDHPLKKPFVTPNLAATPIVILDDIKVDALLYYGMIEATVKVTANYVVYDPQNWVNFKRTGSKAKHLAIILNKNEALHFYGKNNTDDLKAIGKALLKKEKAEVIVIKNGSQGALVIENANVYEIPVFKTDNVWPIGSGDIFSAVFAWKWIKEKLPPKDAAHFASIYTAYYCDTKDIPLPVQPQHYDALLSTVNKKKIYLAGPFFTMSERWLIKELRIALKNFGNIVFSPYHDVGIGTSQNIVDEDIKGIINSDILLAVVSGLDPGTLFEIGYAKALNKKVIVFAENISEEDLLMLSGTGCEITSDFSTAVYKASW